MWKKALILGLYLAPSITDGQAKDLLGTLPTSVRAEVETFLKCAATTSKAGIRGSYCNTKLHIASNDVPTMRRCLAKRQIRQVEKLPSFVVPNAVNYEVQFECSTRYWLTIYVEAPGRGTWISGLYAAMP